MLMRAGRGGGDVERFMYGRWAGNRLKIIPKQQLPEGYTDISADVKAAIKLCLQEEGIDDEEASDSDEGDGGDQGNVSLKP